MPTSIPCDRCKKRRWPKNTTLVRVKGKLERWCDQCIAAINPVSPSPTKET